MRDAARHRGLTGVAWIAALLASTNIAHAQAPQIHAATPSGNQREQDQMCANIAASVEATRLDQKRRTLASLEKDIAKRLEALEAKKTS